MKDGIYWNSESEVYGLWKDGEWLIISVLKQDCIDAAVSLGMSALSANGVAAVLH